MNELINTLTAEYKNNANPEIAEQQAAYMKYKFEYFGFKTPRRREICKPFLVKEFLPDKKELSAIVHCLWEKPQRDFHYFAQELVFRYSKKMEEEDIELFEYMVANQSWWDTVDFIASTLMGRYFKVFPEKIDPYIEKWLASGDMWLQRSCLLYQLKYKEDLDTDRLAYVINSLLGSKEFFINKAIGWVLRQYSRTNPDWVIDFAEKTDLANLSRKEALRLL